MILSCRRVSDVDRQFFEQFGTLAQRYKEKELMLNTDKSLKLEAEEEQVMSESQQNLGSSMTGLTWDNLSYSTNTFTFNQTLQKKDVSIRILENRNIRISSEHVREVPFQEGRGDSRGGIRSGRGGNAA